MARVLRSSFLLFAALLAPVSAPSQTIAGSRNSISVAPAATSMRAGTARKFYAQGNGAGPNVFWRVNGVKGGNPAVGVITSDGTYTAPAAAPQNNVIEVEAVSAANVSLSGKASVTILNPLPVVTKVDPAQLTFGPQSITVTGNGFIPGSQIKIGTAVLPTRIVAPNKLLAATTIAPTIGEVVAVSVINPDPGGSAAEPAAVPVGPLHPKMSPLAATRFLEQASWGPDPASIRHLQEVGFDAWLDEQFASPPSLYQPSTDTAEDLTPQQSEFFIHATTGRDQLRQRVAFALSQVFVVSGLKTGQPRQIVPYENMLLNDAFTNYATVLHDVTLSPTMGVYLDMVNNDKADSALGTSPNENYARELLQLFSIGTVHLKSDGSDTAEATYDQHIITDMSRALTGWTFPGATLNKGHNPENLDGPMIAVESNHDEGQKTVIGGLHLPAGQSAQQDLDAVLHALATHSNTAPFISLRLIQHLVTSDPSAAYLQRVSQAFTSSGGDLKAVVRQILLDPDARSGDDPKFQTPAASGHWREPVLSVLAIMRNLQATARNDNRLERFPASLGQRVFYPTSVFNDYSPLYRTSKGLLAPEFELLSSGAALMRANVVRRLIDDGLGGDALFYLSPFVAFAGSPSELTDAVSNQFLGGRLPAGLKSEVVKAISTTHDYNLRVRSAIYLIASSSLYQVQH